MDENSKPVTASRYSSCTKLPVLKYRVSEALATSTNHTQRLKTCDETRDNGFNRPAIITEVKAGAKEGSGDIATKITNYLNTQAEADVENLISAAYERGSELLQAGADLAYQIFSDETGRGRKKETSRKKEPNQLTQSTNSGYVATQCTSCNCETNQSRPEIALQARTSRPTNISQVVVSPRLRDSKVSHPDVLKPNVTSIGSTVVGRETDGTIEDTAHYNGYEIQVRGRRVALETLFVNGSGPSQLPVEIWIRLYHPKSQHSLYGQLTREYGGPNNDMLHLTYVHGDVEGFIDITCPPQVQPKQLITTVSKDNSFLVIAVPSQIPSPEV